MPLQIYGTIILADSVYRIADALPRFVISGTVTKIAGVGDAVALPLGLRTYLRIVAVGTGSEEVVLRVLDRAAQHKPVFQATFRVETPAGEDPEPINVHEHIMVLPLAQMAPSIVPSSLPGASFQIVYLFELRVRDAAITVTPLIVELTGAPNASTSHDGRSEPGQGR